MTRHFRTFLLFAVLFAAWLLMSGHYTPLLITLGVVSCAGAALLADRIGGTDEEGLPLHVMARLPAYLAWLVKEIIMSNIATGRLILFGRARPVRKPRKGQARRHGRAGFCERSKSGQGE